VGICSYLILNYNEIKTKKEEINLHWGQEHASSDDISWSQVKAIVINQWGGNYNQNNEKHNTMLQAMKSFCF
jgi:hypothetical protein